MDGTDSAAVVRVDDHHSPVRLVDRIQQASVCRQNERCSEVRCELPSSGHAIQRNPGDMAPVVGRIDVDGSRVARSVIQQSAVRRVGDARMHLDLGVILLSSRNADHSCFGCPRAVHNIQRKWPPYGRRDDLLSVRTNRHCERKWCYTSAHK